MKKYSYLLMLFLLQAGLVLAQSFTYKWRLDSVNESGFRSLIISPEISRYLRVDFNDLRIVDESNNNVPHIIRAVGMNWSEQLFKEFPILSSTITDSFQSILIISNAGNQPIAQLKIFLRNSSVSRPASLSGSNDNKTWYIIDDKLQLNRSYETLKDQYIQELNFPPSNYKYFKLVVDNIKNDPLNIVRAGSYLNINYRSFNPYLQNLNPLLKQKDSAGETFLEMNWPNAIHLNKLNFNILAPKFYNRNLRIYLPKYNEGVIMGLGEPMGFFTLRSGTNNTVDFPRIKTDKLYCAIENGDNPPLQIKEVGAEQVSFEVIAYLEKNKYYALLLGDSMASSPNYDLSTFKDSIPLQQKFVTVLGNPEMIKPAVSKKEKDTNRWWIWPALAVLILSLAFLTYKLVLDMKTRDS